MAYSPISQQPAHKDFHWFSGDPKVLHLSLDRAIADGETFECHARSKYTGGVHIFDVAVEGSNAGYLAITIPAGTWQEPFGFKYKIYSLLNGIQDSVVASGEIISTTENQPSAL